MNISKVRSKNLYLIIGAQRSGTTFLYHLLEQHSSVCMAKPVKPEPRFFLTDEYYNGAEYYFNKYYAHRNLDNTVFVEKSTTYYENNIVPQRLVNDFSEIKLIMILRNPVERALSNYFFSKQNKLEKRSLEQVFIEETPPPNYSATISTNPFNYIERGKYINYIKEYVNYIDLQKIYITSLECLLEEKNEIINLFRFLNVSKNEPIGKINHKINESRDKEEVSTEIIDKLQEIYKPFNNELFSFLGRKIY